MAERDGIRPAQLSAAEDPLASRAERSRATSRIDLDRLVRAVPHGVAAAVIDLAARTTVAARTFEPNLERDIDLLAEAAAEFFHGTSLTTLESMDLDLEQDSWNHREAVQKVIVQSRHLLYVFLRAQARPNLVLATLCRADANLGLVMMVARETLRELEDSE